MTAAVLFGAGEFREGRAERRNEEERIVAEPAGTAGFVRDPAGTGPDEEEGPVGLVRMNDRGGADVIGRPCLVGHAAEAFQEEPVVGLVELTALQIRSCGEPF